MKFRKKPVVVEAVLAAEIIEHTGRNWDMLPSWVRIAYDKGIFGLNSTGVKVATSEGIMQGLPTDWIIQGVKGEIYPCKPDIFAATYDVVVDAVPGGIFYLPKQTVPKYAIGDWLTTAGLNEKIKLHVLEIIQQTCPGGTQVHYHCRIYQHQRGISWAENAGDKSRDVQMWQLAESGGKEIIKVNEIEVVPFVEVPLKDVPRKPKE